MALGGGSETPDPFLIPGTETLRNRFNERDPDKLAKLERVFARERAMQGLMGVTISADGLRRLHRHLFRDVYQWAGETRQSMTMSKGDAFLHGRFVDSALAKQFDLLKAENNLKGLTADEFAERAAFHIAEINFIHPFREGNGRTMRPFLRELARQARHRLDIGRIDDRAWMQASVVSTRVQDYRPMGALIRSAIAASLREVTPKLRARLALTKAKAEVSKLLPDAVAQAERQLATITAVGDQGVRPRHVMARRRADERILDYLRSDRGAAHQLEVLRAAGVREITAPGRQPQTALDRILAIGRAAARALEELLPHQREQALEQVLSRERQTQPE